MKVYISLPISGHDIEQCRRRVELHRKTIEGRGHKVVSPFDVCPESDLTYPEYIGRDITALLNCDAILLLSGWSLSKGCRLEWQCAEIYGKKIYKHINQIKSINNENNR